MGGKNPQKGRKDQLHVYIQPRCVSVVAFVFLIELVNATGLIGDMKFTRYVPLSMVKYSKCIRMFYIERNEGNGKRINFIRR